MKQWLARTRSQKGVTLIELLVVVVILGIIAAVAIPMVITNQEDAYANTNKQNMKIINDALERYAIDMGSYPSNLSVLTSTYGSKGPWLKELPFPLNKDGSTGAWDDTELANGKVKIPAGYPGT